MAWDRTRRIRMGAAVLVVALTSICLAIPAEATYVAPPAVVDTIAGVGQPFGIAISPDGRRAYVANGAVTPGRVQVIDTATNAILTSIAVGVDPQGIAITPDGTRGYVTNSFDDTVSAFSTATNTVIGAPIPVDDEPVAIAITPNGDVAYVANQRGYTLSVVDINPLSTHYNTVVNTVSLWDTSPAPDVPGGIAVTPDGQRVLVTTLIGNRVTVFDTDSYAEVGSTVVGEDPVGIAITPDGAHAYVANGVDNNVSIIDLNTYATTTISVGDTPGAVAITPDGAYVYVANNVSNSVSVIDTRTNTVSTTIAVGINPYAIAITPNGRTAYITNSHPPGSISVIDTGYVAPVSTGTPPPDVLQQVGMPASGLCSDISIPELNWAGVPSSGWGASWAQWLHDGAGGAVCTRTLHYDVNQDRWTVAG